MKYTRIEAVMPSKQIQFIAHNVVGLTGFLPLYITPDSVVFSYILVFFLITLTFRVAIKFGNPVELGLPG